ncbi:MAG: hypothetical protein QW568_04510 [Candidatus Anstonellaceae archaeon]
MHWNKYEIKSNFLKRFRMALWALAVALVFIAIKFFILAEGMELFSLNALFPSAIAGAIFVLGFLLAGILTDYKDAEKIPAELCSSLESIWEEGKYFGRNKQEFDLVSFRDRLTNIIQSFFKGLGHEGGHHKLEECLRLVNMLSESFGEMETLGMPATSIVRLKNEQTALRRNISRVYYIQRTQFLPSAHVFVESLVFGIILLLLFVKTGGSPELIVLFGFMSYFLFYILQLVRTLEKPFRHGDETLDDVSLYLIEEFEKRLAGK